MKPAIYFLAGVGATVIVVHAEFSGFRRDVFGLIADFWGKKP